MRQILCFITLLFCLTARGQGILLKGRPVDPGGHALDGATVRLYRDSVAVRQTRAGANGFVLQRLGAGRYRLSISFTGFRDWSQSLQLRTSDSVVNLSSMVLSPGVDSSLLEVVVKATIPPMIMKKDTVVYNAAAYKMRPNASVEELLKKLPGVSVDKDGGVTLNGKKVEKIYVGGKEFMLNDPKIITQGFNADMIAAVEAFDNTSEDSRFMGIRDMNAGAALNFTLKKQYRNSTFGKLYAGMDGEAKRYTAGASLEQMRPESWTSVAIHSNSVNGLFAGNEQTISAIPAGENRHTDARINYSGRRFNGGYGLSDDLREQQTLSDRQTFFPDSILQQHSVSGSRSYAQNHNLTLRKSFKLDSMRSVELSGGGRYGYSEGVSSTEASVSSFASGSGHFLSNSVSRNGSSGNTYGASANLAYRQRFRKKGKFLVVSVNGNFGGGARSGAINNSLVYSGGTVVTDQVSEERSPSFGFGVSGSYTVPVSASKVFDVNYGLAYARRRNERQAYRYNPSTGRYDTVDTVTTNDIRATSLTQRFALGYNVATKVIRYQFGIAAQDNLSDNEVLAGAQQSFSQHVLNWFPRASLSWQIAQNESFQLNYSGSTTAPTIEQLQPLPDLRNPLVVRIGNPDLRPQFDHHFVVNYNRFKPKAKRGFTTGVTLHIITDKLVQAVRNLAGGVQEIRYENLDGNFDLAGNASSSLGLGDDGRVKLSGAVHYGVDPGFVNGTLSRRTMFGVRPSVNLSYTLLDRLSFDGDALIDLSRVDYSVGAASVLQFTQSYSCALRYELPGGWVLGSDFHYQRQKTGSGLPVLDNRLLNAVVTKRVLGSGQLRVAAYDLLGSARGIAQSLSDQSVETSVTSVPERVVLVTFSWGFRRSGG